MNLIIILTRASLMTTTVSSLLFIRLVGPPPLPRFDPTDTLIHGCFDIGLSDRYQQQRTQSGIRVRRERGQTLELIIN